MRTTDDTDITDRFRQFHFVLATTDCTDKMNFSEPIRVIRAIRGSLLCLYSC
jgi:hypothetical protein